MGKRLKVVAGVVVVFLAGAQFIRPDLSNPVTDPGRTIGAQVGTSSRLVAVLDRACATCHSNATVWPWYARMAPTSWLMARGVREGREAVNFSEWAAYPPDAQRARLAASCRAVSSGRMPGPYSLLDPKTKLSAQGIESVCAAARQANDTGGKHGSS